MIDHHAGLQIPGGCDDCDAYQTMQNDPQQPGLTYLNIHHDDTCPTYARITEAQK